MAISAPGIGSGLDVNGLVSQLMAIERRPLIALGRREASAQERISALGQLVSRVSSLQTAADGLRDVSRFVNTRASVSPNAGFTATSAANAAAGSYAVSVERLASVQRVGVALEAFAADTSDPGSNRIAAGTLQLRFGDLGGASNNSAANNPTTPPPPTEIRIESVAIPTFSSNLTGTIEINDQLYNVALNQNGAAVAQQINDLNIDGLSANHLETVRSGQAQIAMPEHLVGEYGFFIRVGEVIQPDDPNGVSVTFQGTLDMDTNRLNALNAINSNEKLNALGVFAVDNGREGGISLHDPQGRNLLSYIRSWPSNLVYWDAAALFGLPDEGREADTRSTPAAINITYTPPEGESGTFKLGGAFPNNVQTAHSFGVTDTGAGFNDLSGSPARDIAFAGGTIFDLRDAINAAGVQVRASVINDGSTQRLVLTGTATGVEKGFSISGLGIAEGDLSEADGASVRLLQRAVDSAVVIDGMRITRANNEVSDVIDGVTLRLTRADPGTNANLTVAEDRSAARSAINAFVNAYNEAIGSLQELTRFDATTRQGAVLTGDATARNLQSQLRTLVGGALSGLGNTARLSDLGISVQRDGKLSTDEAKLTAALNDPEQGVAAFFAGAGNAKGFAERASAMLGGFIGSGGLLTARSDGIRTTLRAIETQRESINRRLEGVESRLRAQFNALEEMMASLSTTGNYLSQQLATLPGARQRSD